MSGSARAEGCDSPPPLTTLVRIVRDPRSGEVHAPNERVAILAIIQNLNRTLLRVRWEAGGDCARRSHLEAGIFGKFQHKRKLAE